MRHGYRRYGCQPLGHFGRGGPRDRGAPVVSDQVHLLRTAGIDQCAEIADEFGHAVVATTGWAGTR